MCKKMSRIENNPYDLYNFTWVSSTAKKNFHVLIEKQYNIAFLYIIYFSGSVEHDSFFFDTVIF